jgi:hypothetical protein
LTVLGLVAGCTGGPSGPPRSVIHISAGPVTPSPVAVTIHPSALPLGQAMATRVVIDGQEMIVYLWGTLRYSTLDIAWRDTTTGAVTEQLRGFWTVAMCTPTDPAFLAVDELSTATTVVDFGAVRAPATRIVADGYGESVPAAFTTWTADPSVTVFWLVRSGPPIPSPSPVGDGRSVGLPPENYPLLTVYHDDTVVASTRIRTTGGGPRD